MKRVISLDSIKMESINRKYIISKSTGRLVLDSKYRNFKKKLIDACEPYEDLGPYSLIIHMETYLDIDNVLKCILDAVNEKIGNDKDIFELRVYKKPIKRGLPGRLDVYIDSLVSRCNQVKTI